MQTLPSLECDEWKSQCTLAHPNDLAGQNFCQGFTCGKKNASAGINAPGGSSSSASATSGGSTASATESGGAAATSSKSAAANVVLVGREYGTGFVLLGLTALFGLAL
jgi:hypothetical protein